MTTTVAVEEVPEYVNYEEAANELKTMNWFKPKPGRHKIVPLSEVSIVERTINLKDGTTKDVVQGVLDIEVNKERMSWSFDKRETTGSLYGQVIIWGKINNGKLTGKPFTLYVKSDGSKNDYSILEVLDYLAQKRETVTD